MAVQPMAIQQSLCLCVISYRLYSKRSIIIGRGCARPRLARELHLPRRKQDRSAALLKAEESSDASLVEALEK